MHDIGKVERRTEILNKPDKLTEAEFEILRRHTVDGAEILSRTPEMPHWRRWSPSSTICGWTEPGIRSAPRATLNLGTMLCGIADVYDAMRSQRVYQQAFPTDRILAVLQRNDGTQFDQNLVRRFVQLVGIYPAGNLVRLDTGEIAVVLQVHAPDPYRPRVRVLIDRDGNRLDRPYDRNLWESATDREGHSIVAPVEPRSTESIR